MGVFPDRRTGGVAAAVGVVAVTLLGGCQGGVFRSPPKVEEPVADPARYERSIVMFGAADHAIDLAQKRVLYLGSSSIRRWDTTEAFDGIAGYNRGFGGSQISDSIHYFDRVVTPYHPEVIVFYAGDNDINFGKSVDRVVADFHAFVGLMREKTPGTRLVFIAIKPSVKRWELWPQMEEVNNRIADACAGADDLFFADIATPMLETGAPPSPTLFAQDGLHLSPEGETMWVGVIQPVIGYARR